MAGILSTCLAPSGDARIHRKKSVVGRWIQRPDDRLGNKQVATVE